MNLSTVYKNRLSTWLLRPGESAPARPAAVYLALYTASSGPESGTEVSGGSYARCDCSSLFGAPASGVSTTTDFAVFAAPTADWGTVSHVSLYDAASGGNLITEIVALAAPVVVSNGDPAFGFLVGDITHTFG